MISHNYKLYNLLFIIIFFKEYSINIINFVIQVL